jgi:hypothetical protein
MAQAGFSTQSSGQAVFGPCLHEAMSPASTVDALNAWGSARDREAYQLRMDLTATQMGVSGAFSQAQAAVQELVTAFRVEVGAMRATSLHEAQASLERLELVVSDARARFGEQDARFAAGLGALAQRLQAADSWAQEEPTRVAALLVAAAPAPPAPGWRTPPQPDLATSPARLILGPALSSPTGWAAYAAGRAAQGPEAPDAWAQAQRPPQQQEPQEPQQPQQQPQQHQWPRHFDIASPPGFGGYGGKGGGFGGFGGDSGGKGGSYPRDLRINARDWGDQKKLDVTTTYDRFMVWKDRAVTHLSKERPDVRSLLTWAEKQSQGELAANLGAAATRFGVTDLEAVEYALHDGIKAILLDSLLVRARNCVGRGTELWRALSAEWSGAAPQLRDARARSFQEPTRCKDTHELWSKLPAWERLGEEVALSDLVLPEWMRNMALEKLLPAPLLATLVSRNELVDYPVRLAWVKTQMEHARGIAQATAYGHGSGKDASGDVHMYSVDAPAASAEPSDGGLAWALANAVDQQDWAQAELLQGAIYAVKGGGKGGGRKGLGKGSPKGGQKGTGKPDGKVEFNGACNHCGIWGHRRSECRKLTAELGKAGGPKGKAGGKGGPAGGKGPAAAPLAEVAEDWAGSMLDDAIAGATAEFDEWNFSADLCSVTAAPYTAAASASSCLVPAGYTQTSLYKPYSYIAAASELGKGRGKLGEWDFDAPICSVRAAPWQEMKKTGKKTLPYIAAATSASSRLATAQASENRHPAVGRWESAAQASENRHPAAGRLAPKQTKNSFAALSLLTDDAEELLAAVSGGARGGRVVEAVVDSGAVHSVTPPGLFPGPTVPSPWSRAGRGYRAANGTGIKNLGQVAVRFCTAEGDRCSIPFQVAEVDQPLLSVAHLTSAGNRVELGHASGRVVNLTTGRAIALERRGGVYIMRMYIADGAAPAPFRRQGA